jgi:two-component system osmolarity sensor histidine kinase EnvZ
MSSPRSILWRTFGVTTVALVLSTITTLVLVEVYASRPSLERRIANFVGHLTTISAALETMSDDVEEEFIRRIAVSEGVRIIHSTHTNLPEGLVVAPDRGSLTVFRDRFRRAFGPETEVYIRPADEYAPLSLLWVRMTVPPHDEYWIGIPRGHIEAFAPSALVLGTTAVLAIALLASFLIILRINRPLAAVARAADAIGLVDSPPRVAEAGPDEIRAVARAVNRMIDRLRDIERDRATFLAGVSHDLRTPLSHVRLELSMVRGQLEDGTRRDILADLEDMNAILDNFIDFARTEVAEACSAVDLSELARECAERMASLGARIQLDLSNVPTVELRPLAIQRLVKNLLLNAQRHGGGEILLRTSVEGDRLVLSVLDRGPGIPTDQVEAMKRPFARKDDSRGGAPGAGLGLAISDRIARLHGGTLDLRLRDGGGLEARFEFPYASNREAQTAVVALSRPRVVTET